MCDNDGVTPAAGQFDATLAAPRDLVVVGDGILGLAIALACRGRNSDLRITIVGPVDRPGAATPAAAAMLTAFAEVESDTLADDGRRSKFELARRSVPRWPEWIAAHADRAGVAAPSITPGTVVTVTDPAIDGPTLAAIREAADRFGVATESLEVRDVPGLRPRRTPPEAPALRIAGEGAIDPIEVLAVLDAAAAASNIRRLTGTAIRLDEGAVTLDTGAVLHADRLVIANGARASALLDTHPELSARVPRVRFGTGVGIRATLPIDADIPREVVRTPNRPDGHGVYYAPHGHGRFYVGATCDVADEPREAPRIAALRRILDAAMDDLSATLGQAECRPVLGHRPVAADGLPLIGRATDTIRVATGTHRDGLVSAPEIADLLAAEIVDGVDAIPTALRPCRLHAASQRA